MHYNPATMLKQALIAVVVCASALLAQPAPPQPAPQQTLPAGPQAAAVQSNVAQSNAPAFVIKQLGKGVYCAISARAGGNTGFIVGDDAVLVVDTFISMPPARELLAEIRKVTNLPIKYVVNTHYHLDHVAGNAVFTEVGATVIAQHNERAWLRTENLKFYQQNGATPTPEQRAQIAALVEPQITFDQAMDVNLGGRTVHIVSLPGHTGGDSIVFVPDVNVIFMGDLLWNNRIPNLIDATTSAWIPTLTTILKAHTDATYVPGHGDIAGKNEVFEFAKYLSLLRSFIKDEQKAGKSGDALTQAVLAELKPYYGTWPGFDRLGPLNIQQTAAELNGTKKIPQPAE